MINTQCYLWDCLRNKSEHIDYIKALLSVKTSEEFWSGLLAVPPGSLVENIVTEFDIKTNIPLEIPFFVFMHFLAGYLIHNDIKIKIDSQTMIRTDIWTVLLAPSGSSKSFSIDTIKNNIPELENISKTVNGIQSGAAFFDLLIEHNHKLLIRDEFNELYRRIKDPTGPFVEIKDYFLQGSSGHGQLSRQTKQDGVRIINDVCFAFLGLTVGASFTDTLSPDDMVNGFSQRFGYILAQKDLKKKYWDYPHYNINSESWRDGWQHLAANLKHKEYCVSPEGMEVFKTTFRSMAHNDLDESFYRRIMFRAHKYALLYHILRGQGDIQEISHEDYGWAARITHLHLLDCKSMLDKYGQRRS